MCPPSHRQKLFQGKARNHGWVGGQSPKSFLVSSGFIALMNGPKYENSKRCDVARKKLILVGYNIQPKLLEYNARDSEQAWTRRIRPDIPWLSCILRRTCLRLILWLMVRWHHVHVTPITKNIKAPGQIWQQRTWELGIEVRAYDSALYNCKYINWNTQCARVWHCRHTSYLSQTPRIYSCKFFLAGVNFYRFNAKNWQFTVYFAVITQKIGNLLCILS